MTKATAAQIKIIPISACVIMLKNGHKDAYDSVCIGMSAATGLTATEINDVVKSSKEFSDWQSAIIANLDRSELDRLSAEIDAATIRVNAIADRIVNRLTNKYVQPLAEQYNAAADTLHAAAIASGLDETRTIVSFRAADDSNSRQRNKDRSIGAPNSTARAKTGQSAIGAGKGRGNTRGGIGVTYVHTGSYFGDITVTIHNDKMTIGCMGDKIQTESPMISNQDGSLDINVEQCLHKALIYGYAMHAINNGLHSDSALLRLCYRRDTRDNALTDAAQLAADIDSMTPTEIFQTLRLVGTNVYRNFGLEKAVVGSVWAIDAAQDTDNAAA